MMKRRNDEPQEWWKSLSDGERRLIWNVMKMLRGAKRSAILDVARAAAKWESGIGCFIKFRLMNSWRTTQRRRVIDSGWVKVEGRRQNGAGRAISSPSNGHSQPGAAANRD
ncbi:MAG TPA: hypothetical protein PK202_14250 [Verrucomicrobiota bacterium]|jgi:hypothetical protein|nr:hypothetical protein [Verrucomicrobiota bacterium]HOC52062.1 hypothetical protein [Verrucomicrobiota bacterium]HOX64107.1 hypothetical protein [Verrucomicrobiota bacterium]HPI66452.1 hypothetical protein [Verrucomicrobiota bacterium]HPO44112.1 hypothetical protein [Verrucomicrobiota bacterium]